MPQTPTVHALREDRYKYIRFHGLWDLDELYDLAEDPTESDNLLARPGHEELAGRLSTRLFGILEKTEGMQIPMSADAGTRMALRDPEGARQAGFPPEFFERPQGR